MGFNPVEYIPRKEMCCTSSNNLRLLKICNISRRHIGLKIPTLPQNSYVYESYSRSRIRMFKVHIIKVIILTCLVEYDCLRKYESRLSRVLYTLQNCGRFCIRHGRIEFKRNHLSAIKPTDMLQNSDFTYSY
jgi:hypothetical protein